MEIQTRETDPRGWAQTRTALGNAYADRLRGDNAENLEIAIACFEDVLQIRTPNSDPHGRAATLVNLGITYRQRLRGERAENIESSIRCYEEALQVLSREADPQGWAITRFNLGTSYLNRARGDRAENLERAIACFRDALTVQTRETDPHGWADLRSNLGLAYADRLHGNKAENIKNAIACYQDALTVKTREADPHGWADVRNNLGAAYDAITYGDRGQNLEQAIACYEDALEVETREVDPINWAKRTANLGTALRKREHGERAENLERAIACHESALQVLTREADPYSWARTTFDLGIDYVERVQGDTTTNLKKAVDCFEDAIPLLYRFDPSTALRALNRAGGVYGLLGRLSDARQMWRQALEVREMLLMAGTSYKTRSETGRSSSFTPSGLATLEAELGMHGDAVQTLERGRAISLRTALETDGAWLAGLPEEWRTPIVEGRRRLGTLRANPPQTGADHVPGQVQAWDEEIRATEARLRQALAAVGCAPPALDIRSLAALAPGHGALVLFSVSLSSLAFVLPGGSAAVDARHVVALPSQDVVRQWVIKWNRAYHSMMNRSRRAGTADISALREANAVLEDVLEAVWTEVMDPVVTKLEELGISQGAEIVLLPHGDLALLPLHAAGTGLGMGGRCVLDDYTVRYAPSGMALQTASERLYQQQIDGIVDDDGRGRGFLGLFNPATGREEEALASAEADEMPSLKASFERAGQKCFLCAGEEATKAIALARSKDAGYLHFGCHGRFDLLHPENSGLSLARGDHLSVSAILQELQLERCRLVTMSACETGIVDVLHLPDEFIGLPSAFLQAGAPGVMATFWSVLDAPSAALTRRFYALHLAGMSAASALRKAVFWLRDGPEHALEIGPDGYGPALSDEEHKMCALPIIWAAYAYHGV